MLSTEANEVPGLMRICLSGDADAPPLASPKGKASDPYVNIGDQYVSSLRHSQCLKAQSFDGPLAACYADQSRDQKVAGAQ